jgi:Transposase IS4
MKRRRHDHWPDFERYMSKFRWDQIHRFLTFNIESTNLPQNEPQSITTPWFYRIEPVHSIIRANCIQAVTPSSWIVVDEAMVPFSGRSLHTVKLPNKPITKGFKAWALGFEGYYYDWLLYSPIEGSEGCLHKKSRVIEAVGPILTVALAETF